MLGNLRGFEWVIIGAIILLLFGAKRLPEIGSSLGKGIREFKKSMKEVTEDIAALSSRFDQQRPDPVVHPWHFFTRIEQIRNTFVVTEQAAARWSDQQVALRVLGDGQHGGLIV